MSGNPSAQPRPLVRSSRGSAKDRLAKFYIGLSADKKALLRNWLVYLRDRAATRSAKDATDDEAKAAALVFNVFGPNIKFLEWMLNVVGVTDSGARKVRGP